MAGWGECGPLPGLSPELNADFESVLNDLVAKVNASGPGMKDPLSILRMIPPGYSSVRFGFETALLDLQNGGRRILYRNGFVEGEPIPINGLIWMGDMDFLMDQINRKVEQGFRCLKLKVGGLNFERECDVLHYIRKKYFRENITIRLDANGGFKTDEVLYNLGELARFDVHSIEQPLKPGMEAMEELCRKSPIPVAFDEELIGIETPADKVSLLKRLKPRFIVLKPSLHGGISGCEEWIRIAGELNIGWWMTSALESSIGLNAICQFTANYNPSIPQGLGTGAIYENNIPSPLKVSGGKIFYDTSSAWAENPDVQ